MLKQLIQRLLDSRTTPEQAAHSAMPKPELSTIISEVVADKGWHSLIAPFDGYFSAKAITNHLLIENSSSQWQGVTALTNAGYMGFTLPMTKGSEVRYQLDPISTGVILSFSRAIGGGYNCLIKEVQLCLRTSYSSCLKLLSRVKRLGLANSPTYRIRQLTTQSPASPHSQTEKVHLTKHIRHQMTAGLLADIGLYRHYLCQTFQNLKLVVEKLGEKIPTKTCEFSSLVVKGIVYGCGLELLRQKEQPDFLGSFPRLELFNLAKGGLPC